MLLKMNHLVGNGRGIVNGGNRLLILSETLCVSDWARKIGITEAGIRKRISKGLSVDKCLSPKKLIRY